MTYTTAQFGRPVAKRKSDIRDPSIINAFGNPLWAARNEGFIGGLMLKKARDEGHMGRAPVQFRGGDNRLFAPPADHVSAVKAVLCQTPQSRAEIADRLRLTDSAVKRVLSWLKSHGKARYHGGHVKAWTRIAVAAE